MSTAKGPLAGLTVLELGGIGPGPFAAMMLADLGADVIRVERPTGTSRVDAATHHVLHRGRRSLAIDLKRRADVVLDLIGTVDVVIEGFRPGVAERLGLGPDDALARNPRIVYGRMTGWGQDGPLAHTAGHDITYLALAGALEPIVGEEGRPVPPLNMLGDFGGGGMLLALGIVTAVLHARTTGEGQVVDASIVDGTALLTGMLHGMRDHGMWGAPRGHNLFDGGAPFYRTYETADGRWIAVGAIEPVFYARLLEGLGLAEELADVDQDEQESWVGLSALFERTFARRTRDEWVERFAGLDACVAPVLAPDEVLGDPHHAARATYVERDGGIEPAPAPRFSRTPATLPAGPPATGSDTRAVLGGLGVADDVLARWLADGSISEGARSE